GGLDCRHLLANIKDRPYRVESLTTICTPHRGSPIMDWFRDNMGLGRRHCTEYTKSNYSSPSWSPQANTSVMTSRQNLQRHANTTNAYTHSNPANYITPAVARLQAWTDKVITKYLDEPAYAHLTTDFCNNYFNENTPNDPTVQYYSYGAAAQSPVWWSSMLSLPWQMVYEKEGDNDGFVSVKSAAWGNYVKTIEDADHWDFTGKR
ncbi:hypothetical protein BDF20DRAFT_820821, partial [Mycotypha africana]|uniref:uncharacterized protein n=1 Tax=Mycotypha africana TaxID=64632 RepID=UPI0022FFE973